MSEKRFAIGWFATFLIGLVLAGAANFVIDPYGMFEVARIEGVNVIKPAADTRVTTAKIYQVLKAQPKTLILGNSRPEMGLNPASGCWAAGEQPVYNMGLPGQGLYRQVRYGQHAMAAGEAGTVLLGLDILDFLIDRNRPDSIGRGWPDPTQETRAWLVKPDGQEDSGFLIDRLDDGFRAILSVQALADSIGTVLQQENADAPTRTERGFNPGERIYGGIIRNEGVGVLFEQKNKSLARRMTGQDLSITTADGKLSPDFAVLEGFLTYARLKGVRVIPFINPYHADYMLLIDRAGLWDEFDAWRRQLTAIVTDSGHGPLWDFNEFSPLTTENVEDVADRGQALTWFWEPSHYRQELGEIMLARMLNRDCGQAADWPDFGVLVSPATIDNRLEDLALERDLYMLGHPDSVMRISKLIGRDAHQDLSLKGE